MVNVFHIPRKYLISTAGVYIASFLGILFGAFIGYIAVDGNVPNHWYLAIGAMLSLCPPLLAVFHLWVQYRYVRLEEHLRKDCK